MLFRFRHRVAGEPAVAVSATVPRSKVPLLTACVVSAFTKAGGGTLAGAAIAGRALVGRVVGIERRVVPVTVADIGAAVIAMSTAATAKVDMAHRAKRRFRISTGPHDG